MQKVKEWFKNFGALVFTGLLVVGAFLLARARWVQGKLSTPPPEAPPTELPPVAPQTQEEVQRVETQAAAQSAAATATATAKVETLTDIARVDEGKARREALAKLARKS